MVNYRWNVSLSVSRRPVAVEMKRNIPLSLRARYPVWMALWAPTCGRGTLSRVRGRAGAIKLIGQGYYTITHSVFQSQLQQV